MNREELDKVESLSIDINTNLCILKNAMTNSDCNDLQIYDLIDFVRRIYDSSNKMREVFFKTFG